MDFDKRYINQIEVITNIFTIDKNKLKIYLVKRNYDPYKGYWMIPSNLLMTSETIEECANSTINEFLGVDNIYLKQCNIFSKIDRLPNDRIIGNSMVGLVDSESIVLHRKKTNYDGVWFGIDEIPKMVYDHGDVLLDAVKYLKNHLTNIDILKVLFPSDFTLPELQLVFEQILGKELDRRNFRKKVLNLNIVEETGDLTNSKMGRPAKLYRFKEMGESLYE